MSFSSLTSSVVPASSSNYTNGRYGNSVCKITPHHMAGVLTGEQCARIFQDAGRGASANYCIGYDGEIVGSVDEENRAWTSSSRSNDSQAITIEVSNDMYGEPWSVSDASWNSLVNLCVDICKRYGFKLYYDETPNGSLTRHNMFANTNCPGQYLQDRFYELADIVNKKIDGGDTPTPPTPPEPTDRIKELTYAVQEWLNDYGYITGVDGIAGPQTCKNVVRVYQNELNKQFGAGLVVDGIYGSKTYDASWRTISQGARGNITKSIQAMLICKQYEVEFTGSYQGDTTFTIAGFQNDTGLEPTGCVDQDTSSLLYT